MNISEVSKTVGLPVKTVRYYADIDLVAPVSRSAAGYRQYDESSVRKLWFIKRSRSFGFSVKECRELLGLYEDRDRSNTDVRAIARERLKDIKIKQQELKLLHDELDILVKACKGDNRPDCPILQGLAKA